MEIEAGFFIGPDGSLRENVRLRLPGSGSAYFETVMCPGFSDAHAHPQVVDVGEGGPWRDAQEWLSSRRLRVDEAALRRDVGLASRLARATMLLSILDGVTLIAMVGSLKANLRAVFADWRRPRVVLLPTIMKRRGWSSVEDVIELYEALNGSWDGLTQVGLFVHSLSFSSPESIRRAYSYTRSMGLPFAMHLSEGRRELRQLLKILGSDGVRVIGVHCTEDEKYSKHGVLVVHCPSSNLMLYGRTQLNVSEVRALGSDWPLLLGSVVNQYRLALRIHGSRARRLLFEAARTGGYRAYGVSFEGDVVAYDEPPERVVEGCASPSYVFVRGRPVVEEAAVQGVDRSYVERVVRELVKEALDRYPAR